jgi:hypothetical protein
MNDSNNNAPGGPRPEDPMLEQRVARLEEDMKEIRSALIRIEAELTHMPKAMDYTALRTEVAEIKGRLTNLPTTLQMLVMLITVWSVGSGIIFAVLRLAVR